MPFFATSVGVRTFLAGVGAYMCLHDTMVMPVCFGVPVSITRFGLSVVAGLSVLGHLGAASGHRPICVGFRLRTGFPGATGLAVSFGIAVACTAV